MEGAGTIRERVQRALETRIAAGLVPEGALLTVPGLAAEFQVSATPVREAVLELQRRGFVEPARNRGFVVTAVADGHAADVAAVRLLLEPPAMAAVAALPLDDQEPRLRGLAAAIATHAEAGDLGAYLDADRTFHLALTDLAGNPMLSAMVEDLRARTRLPGLSALVGRAELAASAAEHDELLDRLLAHDAEGASGVMRRHIGHTTGWWAGRPE
ncbi:GntR family transcriptional regulator [Amnibacterium endophyticum]|uniref:GntR family transcriptional regulator n=1 Tax=Amnibacterium endophyticum TaxID=2109337 RepID=A0ABW4LBW0_9MICO